MPFENIFLSHHNERYQNIIEIADYKFGLFLQKNKNRTNGDNEDALFLSQQDDILRFGVADGAGGHPRGKDASYEVLNEMRCIRNESFLSQIEKANDKVLELKAGARSTLAFAHIEDGRVSFHTVGDSEIIYWNANGRELYSSTPHSPSGFKVAAGITSQEESLSDPERHIVTSLMGDEYVQIHSTTSMELKKGHGLILGSDGIFDNISHQELAEIAALGNFEESFEKICQYCVQQDPQTWVKDDDISFIFLRKTKV